MAGELGRVARSRRIVFEEWWTEQSTCHYFLVGRWHAVCCIGYLLSFQKDTTMTDADTFCLAPDGDLAGQICNIYKITNEIATGVDTFFLIYAVSWKRYCYYWRSLGFPKDLVERPLASQIRVPAGLFLVFLYSKRVTPKSSEKRPKSGTVIW